MEQKKLTLDEFNEYKNKLLTFLQESQDFFEQNKDTENFNIEEYEATLYQNYFLLQAKLLSYNLSSIPFDAWNDIMIISDDKHIADFSKTHANLDFNILGFEGVGNFKECNIKNPEKLANLNEEFFDEQTISQYPQIFLSSDFNQEFKQKFYHRNLSVEDLSTLTERQLNELKNNINFSKALTSYNYSMTLSLDKAIELVRYSKEEYEKVIEQIEVLSKIGGSYRVENIENVPVTKIGEVFADQVHHQLERQANLDSCLSKLPKRTIQENEDIFLTQVPMSNDLRIKYYNRRLEYEDIKANLEIFSHLPLECFTNDYYLYNLAQELGKGTFQKIWKDYPEVIEELIKERKVETLEEYLNKYKEEDIYVRFTKAIKDYYFSDMDLNTSFKNTIELFDFPTFLRIYNICGSEIEHDQNLLEYIHTHHPSENKLLSLSETEELIFNYIQSGKSLKYALILEQLGYNNEKFASLIEKIHNLHHKRPELDLNNPILSADLLSDEIVEKYGYDLISTMLEYDSGASSVLITATKNHEELLEKWITYLKSSPLYNKKMLHLAVLSYPTSKELIEQLISSGVELDKNQLANLQEVLSQQNKFHVSNLENLSNYRQYKEKILKAEVQSNDLGIVKNATLEILFNVSNEEAKGILKECGLNSDLFIETMEKNGHISVEDQAILEIIKELLETKDLDALKNRFNSIIYQGELGSLLEIKEKIRSYIGHEFKECLFKADGNFREGISYSEVDGLSYLNMIDIHGNAIEKNAKIPVVELEGIDFHLLVHRIYSFDPKFVGYSKRINADPSLWNKLEGSSTLSTSLISSRHMRCVGEGSYGVYYGFNDISDKSLMLMGRSDIGAEQGGRKLEPISSMNEYMLPDVLQAVSSDYNEVTLDRKSSSHQEFDHRLQPNCIICFDGNINEDSKRAAQYFDIPIYRINRQKYYKKQDDLIEKYKNEDITTFTREDLKEILYTTGGVTFHMTELSARYETFLKLCDKALSEGIININEYATTLQEGKDIIGQFSAHEDISDLNLELLDKRINTIQNELIIHQGIPNNVIEMEGTVNEGPRRI